MCALIGFAYKLGSAVHNVDPNAHESNSDVRREAKLLMSLSCSSRDDERAMDNDFYNNSDSKHFDVDFSTSQVLLQSSSSSTTSSMESTGRITPTHSITSTCSSGSRRDTFSFTCPSLSLDNARGSTKGSSPGIMLSRTLKLDDKDAMRLSSEAMARNIIESFQKAISWRIQSWVDSLSRVVVFKEMKLKKEIKIKGYTKAVQHQLLEELYFSNEALLVKTLREIDGNVQVLEATTAFKVLNKVSQVDETGSALKKLRNGEEEDRTGLEEGEYLYDVAHVLEMQCSLNISTPAGNIRLDLNVPGKINGTFFNSEDQSENKLTDVTINLNTEMIASMIEKSSRIAVRVSSEALLKGDIQAGTDVSSAPQEHNAPVSEPLAAPVTASRSQSRSPKRKYDQSSVSGLVVVTPARHITSSPSSFGESSDCEGDIIQNILLQIPNNFASSTNSSKILQPQASGATNMAAIATPGTAGLDFATRLVRKKYGTHKKGKHTIPILVTPLKTKGPEYIERGKGPRLPVLMETAGIRYTKK